MANEQTDPVCPHCLGPLPPKTARGPRATYCGAACRSAAAHSRAKTDGRYKKRLEQSRAKHVPKPKHELTCEDCGSAFLSRTALAKFCSQPCQSRSYHNRRKLDGRQQLMIRIRKTLKQCANCHEEWV